MNEKAVETLVQAALRAHKQIKGYLHGIGGGECALGILHLADHNGNRQAALWCRAGPVNSPGYISWATHLENWDIDRTEEARILRANDEQGLDFLTIARKCGVPHE